MTRSQDLGFRLGTGAFGLVLVLLVCGIGVELARVSMPSIQRFGVAFWRTSIWDPVAGEFGALPFIWGTLYSSILALLIATASALGATRFEAIRAALFYARTGIVGAVMLGFGRALGETMAVTMVIGNTPQISLSLFAPQYTMAAVIANEFAEAADNLHLSALVEIGLVLFIITLLVNSLSRLLIWSMARTSTPASVTPEETAEAAA